MGTMTLLRSFWLWVCLSFLKTKKLAWRWLSHFFLSFHSRTQQCLVSLVGSAVPWKHHWRVRVCLILAAGSRPIVDGRCQWEHETNHPILWHPIFRRNHIGVCHLAATCSTQTAGTSDFASAASAIPIHCPWSSSNGFEIQVWEISLSPFLLSIGFLCVFPSTFLTSYPFLVQHFHPQKNTSTLGTTNPSPNRHHQICIPPLPSQSPKPSPSILFVTQPST